MFTVSDSFGSEALYAILAKTKKKLFQRTQEISQFHINELLVEGFYEVDFDQNWQHSNLC